MLQVYAVSAHVLIDSMCVACSGSISCLGQKLFATFRTYGAKMISTPKKSMLSVLNLHFFTKLLMAL